MTTSAAASGPQVQGEGLDDIDASVATFDEEERRELAAAEAAIEIAILLHRVRERRGSAT